MIFEKTELGIGNAILDIYIGDELKKAPAMLVIPGGGYGCVCADREGEPIALAYLSRGFNAFVLHYSVGKDAPVNCPLAEASSAIAYIRRNSEKLGVDPEKVYAVGFSAGGHLCGSLATLWHRDEIKEKAGIEYGENRPTAVVLQYPVITALGKGHMNSFYNLLGTREPTREQLEYYSLEKHVDERSAPAFILHTAGDQAVPVENALYIAEAYAGAKIPFELHIYPFGPHGLALANEVTAKGKEEFIDPQAARWVDDSIVFFKRLTEGK
ncbi:MAG: alpha/beta hydrolase [Ruminococcaceae bacterium]|nr:alpha/beta hydrolase [Oscillospiraceae bacterium]